MSKFKQLKEAMKNPPTERLSLISANGHKYNILAMIAVSIYLFTIDLGYITIIFFFSAIQSWVGYKREMKQYNAILEAKEMMGILPKIEDDPSFTRKRFKTIEKYLGASTKWISLGLFVGLSAWEWEIMTLSYWGKILLILLATLAHMLFMLFPTYWVALRKKADDEAYFMQVLEGPK